MRKLILNLILACLPFFVLAQNDVQVLPDFNTGVRGVTSSFKLNDHVWVMQTCVDKQNYELAAIDDKMQVLWRYGFDGHPLAAGKFKGHILALTASDWAPVRNIISGPYSAMLIDEKTGKLLSSKVIYDAKTEGTDLLSAYFNEDGTNCTFVVRQVDLHKTTILQRASEFNNIQDLTVITLDDNLNPIVSKPKFPTEDFVNLTCNTKGDLFLVTHNTNDKNLKVTKYDAPKYEAEAPIVEEMDVKKESNLEKKFGVVAGSKDNGNVLYMALIHRDPNNDDELTVSKFDFGNHTSKAVNESLVRAHINEIKKAYVPFDKKLDKPDLGPIGLSEKYIAEWNGTLLVVISNQNFMSGTGAAYWDENSLIINGYDANLTTKFQQIMPTSYKTRDLFQIAAYGTKNSLYMIANTQIGLDKFTNCYGQLDLTTGSWVKLELLSKEQLKRDHILSDHVMWFTDGFIVPDEARRMSGTDVSLQLNSY